MYNSPIDHSEDSWLRLRSLFHDAIELPTDLRRDFCSLIPDRGLRTELGRLLSTADELGIDFLEYPAFACRGNILKDRYEIQRVLGRGGQGIVLLAGDLQANGRKVVIKVFNNSGEHTGWLRRRFDKERTILATLKHPGVIGVQDQGDIAGSPFLVMEYVDGKTLREGLQQHLPNAQIAGIVRQMGNALRAAHVLGIYHRDLKPENVMISSDSSVKLIDFGIAQFDRKEAGVTTTVVIVAGTTRYMAPEQFLGISDARSDIYSLALVIFEMLAGKCPYGGDNALELARAQRTRSIRSVLLQTREIPRRLVPVLGAALAIDPDQRPPNAEVFADEVADAILMPKLSLARKLGASFHGLRKSLVAQAVLVILLLLGGLWLAVSVWRETHLELVYETRGGADPVSGGFQPHDDVSATAVFNEDGTGLEAWTIATHSQGHYYRRLTDTQKRLALSKGWTLTAVLKPQEGDFWASVDLVKFGPRFIMGATILKGKLAAHAWKNIMPDFEIVNRELDLDPTAYHEYRMIYNPHLASARIAVDGKVVIDNYKGERQFQDGLDVDFGCEKFKSKAARATFKLVRFQIGG